MKPANFPARKDQRRRDALARLGKSPDTKLSPAQIDAEALRIMERLQDHARFVRSKKPRGQVRAAA